MVCRRRCIWGGVRTLESKGVPKQLLSVVGLVLVDLYLLGSDVDLYLLGSDVGP